MSRSAASTAAWWIAALALAAALLAATEYRTRDADSRAYISIATRLAGEPVSRWIAPQWWGAWGGQGLFREHPAGTFIPPALLTRAGYPPAQALFVVSLACQIASLLLVASLAGRLAPRADARALVWALQLIPIAFVFRVRGNQEYLLLAGLLLAVYGIERLRDSGWWMGVALAGTAWALLVKGVFGLLAPVLAAIWLLSRPPGTGAGRRGWLGVAALVLLAPALAWAYERAYLAVAGQSFLDYYLGARLSLDAGSRWPFPLDKASNGLWYAGRVLWYAAPWSLVLLAAARPGMRARLSAAREWVRFAALGALATVALVAWRDTTADRYVFPAYFLAAAAGAASACAWWPAMAALSRALDRTWPWGPVALWLALVTARVLS